MFSLEHLLFAIQGLVLKSSTQREDIRKEKENNKSDKKEKRV